MPVIRFMWESPNPAPCYSGNVKSAVGIGIILYEGIGDTIRVSLTGDPVEEVKSAKLILRSLGLRKGGIEVVSCPTCGRTQIDLIGLANQVEKMVKDYDMDLKVAVMGCVVNGPGEARECRSGYCWRNRRRPSHQKRRNHKKGTGRPASCRFEERTGFTWKDAGIRMEKPFLEVFPGLHIADELRELLELVTVEKITMTKDRSSIRIYIVSPRLIHKKNIYSMEEGIAKQLFPGRPLTVKILEKYRLSAQYTPKSLYELYKDSILLEFRQFGMIEYTMLKKAKTEFPEDDLMSLTIEDNLIYRERSKEVERVLEKIFVERCGLPAEVRFQYTEPKKKEEQAFDEDMYLFGAPGEAMNFCPQSLVTESSCRQVPGQVPLSQEVLLEAEREPARPQRTSRQTPAQKAALPRKPSVKNPKSRRAWPQKPLEKERAVRHLAAVPAGKMETGSEAMEERTEAGLEVPGAVPAGCPTGNQKIPMCCSAVILTVNPWKSVISKAISAPL